MTREVEPVEQKAEVEEDDKATEFEDDDVIDDFEEIVDNDQDGDGEEEEEEEEDDEDEGIYEIDGRIENEQTTSVAMTTTTTTTTESVEEVVRGKERNGYLNICVCVLLMQTLIATSCVCVLSQKCVGRTQRPGRAGPCCPAGIL